MYQIFDIDNCIADDEWRIPHIDWSQQHPDPRYERYHRLAIHDKPGNLDAVRDTAELVFFTARPQRFFANTRRWLADALEGRNFLLYMRPDGDHRGSVELKRDQLHDFMTVHKAEPRHIWCAYDDREDVVQMYRSAHLHARVLSIHSTSAYHPPEINNGK